MFNIVSKKKLSDNIYIIEVKAPRVAKSVKPGQFVMLRVDEKGERIPFSVCNYNKESGTVTIVFQSIGDSTNNLANLEAGDNILDFAGPLGQPSFLVNEDDVSLKAKKILFVSEGSASARIYPELKWLKEREIKGDVLLNFDDESTIIFKDTIEAAAGKLILSTKDGSVGTKGECSEILDKMLQEGSYQYDIVIAMGSVDMMRDVSLKTKKYNIKTVVSLNTLMLDGTGMCGACRVTIGGETKFACTDGPEFDGHLVDFEEVKRRQNLYSSYEAKAKYREENGKDHSVEGEAALEVETND